MGIKNTQTDADLEEEFRRFDADAEAGRKNRRDRTDEEYFAACKEVPMQMLREAAQASGDPVEDVKEMVLVILKRGMPVDDLLNMLKKAKETGRFE